MNTEITLPTTREAFIKRLAPLEWKAEDESGRSFYLAEDCVIKRRIFQRPGGKWSFGNCFGEMDGGKRYETLEIAKQAYWEYWSNKQFQLWTTLQSALLPETL